MASICRFLILPPCFSFALKNYNSFASYPLFTCLFSQSFCFGLFLHFILLCKCVFCFVLLLIKKYISIRKRIYRMNLVSSSHAHQKGLNISESLTRTEWKAKKKTICGKMLSPLKWEKKAEIIQCLLYSFI